MATTLVINNHLAFWHVLRPSQPFIVEFEGPSIFSPATIFRNDVGNYATEVPQMSDAFHPGNREVVMTTTYGSTTAQCTTGWVDLVTFDDLGVDNRCFDIVTGSPVDAEFNTLVVGNNTVGGTSAFTLDQGPVIASFVPDPSLSFTTGTGTMVINRNGVGDWNVNLGTGSPKGSTFLVSTGEPGATCGLGAFNKQNVRVRCFKHDGTPIDVIFAVLQLSAGRYNTTTSSGATVPAAFAFADQASAKKPYAPNGDFSRSDGGAITVTRTSLGDYTVSFDGFQNPLFDPENVQLTPFGNSFAACTVVGRTNTVTGRDVRVQCRGTSGGLVDSRFTIVLMR